MPSVYRLLASLTCCPVTCQECWMFGSSKHFDPVHSSSVVTVGFEFAPAFYWSMTEKKANVDYISVGYNRASTGAGCDDATGIVAYAAGSFVALWDTQNADSKGVYATLRGHQGRVTTVKHLPGGASSASFISGDQTGLLKIWDHAERGSEATCIASVQAHKLSVSAIGVQAASSQKYKGWFVTGGSDSTVKIWRHSSADEGGLYCVQTIDLGGKLPLDLALSSLPGTDALVLCIACTDKKLQIWTLQADEFEKSIILEGHEDWIRCLALTAYPSASSPSTPDLLLASGSQDNYVRLWRIAAIAERAVVSAPSGGIHGGAADDELSAEMLDDFEKRLNGDDAEGSKQISTKAHLMAVRDGETTRKFNVTLEALLLGHEGWITDLHWSPPSCTDSPILLTTSADSSMIVWSPDAASAIWLNRHRFGEMGGRGLALFGALWGKDGKDVLAGGWNGGWSRWARSIGPNEADVGPVEGSWEPAAGVSGHTGEITSIAWDPKQDYLISVSSDQTSRIHASCSVASSSSAVWAEIARPQIHGYDMTDVAFINRMRFTSGADEKVVRVFDAPAGFVGTLQSLRVSKSEEDMSSRPKGATVPPLGLSNRALGRAPADDIDAGLVNKSFNEAHVSVSEQFDHLPTEDELSSSTLWPEVEKLYGHGYELIAVAASHDGTIVATACKATGTEHAAVRLYDTTTWKYVGEPLRGHSLTITRIAFSKDDRFILTSSRDRTWRMFERKRDGTGYEPVAVAEKAHARIVWDCSWAPDGSCFATASRDKTVKIWAKSSGSWDVAAIIKFTEGTTAVDVLDRSNGSVLLAVGTESGALSIHSISSGAHSTTCLLTLDPKISHNSPVNRISWRQTASDLQIASCSDDHSVRVFSLPNNLL